MNVYKASVLIEINPGSGLPIAHKVTEKFIVAGSMRVAIDIFKNKHGKEPDEMKYVGEALQ